MNSDCTTPNTARLAGQNQDPDSDSKTQVSGRSQDTSADAGEAASEGQEKEREIGGRKGPDPTRYGDWEKGGRCIDF